MTTPWDALLRHRPVAQFDQCQEDPALLKTSKAARVRELLRQKGPMSAAEICMEVDYPNTGLVSASMKHDIAIGRLSLTNGLYAVNPDYDANLHRSIKRARALLRKHGYTVEMQS